MAASKNMSDKARIPEGWRLIRLGDVTTVNPRRPRLDVKAQTATTFIPMAAVGENLSGILKREQRRFQEVTMGYTYFQENDVLFAKITPCLQNGKHAVATQLRMGFGFGTTEFHVIRASSSVEPRHLFRVITQPTIIEKCTRSFTGTAGQQRVQPETLRALPILLPPLPEQRAIAEVLDSIDEAIEKTKSVVAATQRLRDALLHRLLTRGVPGWHSEWKDIRGLGTIPASWEVVRLGEVAEINRANWDPSDGSTILYLDLTSVIKPGILACPKELEARDAPSRARRRLNAGDILVSTVRPNLRDLHGFLKPQITWWLQPVLPW